MAFIQADMDDFKKSVNGPYGDQIGDRVLAEVAEIFRRSCGPLGRRCIGPCRFGGESFALALLDMENQVALGLAEGLRSWIEGLRLPMLRELRATARFVVVIVTASDLKGALEDAHDALYPHPDLKVPNSVKNTTRY